MPKITDVTIDKVNEKIQGFDEAQMEALWERFARQQPAIVGYVLGESKDLKVPDAREDIAYILTVILLSYDELRPGVPAISEAEFEKTFNDEFDEMEAVFQDGFDETDALNTIESFCQPDLLQFAAAVIYSDDGSGDGSDMESNFTEEEAGLFIVIFKTVIALLDAKK